MPEFKRKLEEEKETEEEDSSNSRGFAQGLRPERIIGATESSGELMFLMKWEGSNKRFLFGTADQEDIDRLNSRISQFELSQEAFQHALEDSLTVFNLTRTQSTVDAIEMALGDVTNVITTMEHALSDLLAGTLPISLIPPAQLRDLLRSIKDTVPDYLALPRDIEGGS
ncbi:PREDICTED: uncharacterized protein LOC106816831 [Priapulus caudatus]|uniref:Uncharacterized protein LOC106816831 n=1 Tax=Priapulus caudatus TaxID=37621 RepID=A0ABM1EXN1_PRICU|nr:PREDICTED: uncharacterized protein LOC106816831 [Priapulus caudatus]